MLLVYHVVRSFWQLMVNTRFGELIICSEGIRAVEIVQNVHDASSVPVISNTPSIVDVSSRVLQYLKVGEGKIIVYRHSLTIGRSPTRWGGVHDAILNIIYMYWALTNQMWWCA